ncbi:hypothetical protein BS50DRAFT_537746 [Corynespora cassiicola Philippines]|uniref:Azaphilone pigments biosynthesis cluster protein L N-terminal domain-containing protein n=1 Tax=Corynespora cassiicola Philippines TaxID=1448308 RepID=A0A2T2N1F0_CORCC|nr:hypothetical protein BS50DRAFT_537746 [Corynespora cassiicola Philippines]
MDPFSITAGALGITTFATNSISQLHNFVCGLTEAEDVVQDIVSDLEGIQRTLAALEQLAVSDEASFIAAREDLIRAGVVEAVNRCGDACNDFSSNLKKWTKHSSTLKLSLRDRFSVGVWNRERIRTFKTHLQSCEATVQFAATSSQLIIQLRSEKVSEVDRENLKQQLQALESKIQDHLDLTRKLQHETQERKRELQEDLEDEDDEGAQRLLAIKEVERQCRLLEANQISCGVVFSQARSKRSGQEIGKVITLDESRAMVGLPEAVVGKINQRIEEVRTEKGSHAIVGVFGGNVSMKDL